MSKRLKTLVAILGVVIALIFGAYVVYKAQQPAPSPSPTPLLPSPTPQASAEEVPPINVVEPGAGVCALQFSVTAETTPGLNCLSKELYSDSSENTPGTYTLTGKKLAADFKLVPGQKYIYVISYKNSGTGATTGEIKDTLPSGVEYVDSSAGCTYASATRLVTCAVSSTAPGASSQVAIRVMVAANISVESVTNEATLTPASGSASVCKITNTVEGKSSPSPSPQAGIDCVAKRAYLDNASNTPGKYYLNSEITDTATLTDGQVLVFNIALKNTGSTNISEAKIVDVLSSNLTYMDSENGCTYASDTRTVSCSVADLASNTQTSKSFRAKVVTASASAIANTAQVTGGGQSDSCSIVVNAEGKVVESPSPIPSQLPEAGVFEVTASTLGVGVLLLIVGALGLLLL